MKRVGTNDTRTIHSYEKEDGINEYDLSKRSKNIRICVNYIFEYFDNYSENSPDAEKTFIEERKQEKYRKIVSRYSPDVQDWLVNLNSRSRKHGHKYLRELIDDRYFFKSDGSNPPRFLLPFDYHWRL